MCGVVGVWGHPEAAQMVAKGGDSLQHRGQEAVGIASFDGTSIHRERHMGLVGKSFSRAKQAPDSDGLTPRPPLMNLPGHVAIGHLRYSTSGDTANAMRGIQPFKIVTGDGDIAVAHNGNFTNALCQRAKIEKEYGVTFQSDSDTEVLMMLLKYNPHKGFKERMRWALRQMEGSYAIIAMTDNGRLIGARDPLGIRPLVMGKRDDGAYVMASETLALNMLGAKNEQREIEPGEMVVIEREKEVRSFDILTGGAREERPARPDIFELVYFAHPDSHFNGHTIGYWRQRMGAQLFAEHKRDADVAFGVPDSGSNAGLGYARASGMLYDLGLKRRHFVGRTFIDPDRDQRAAKVRQKLTVNSDVVNGQRVVVVDDSLVRGTTSREVVTMLREEGAKEVHMLFSCPPVKYPDFYGIDTPERKDLLSATVQDPADVAKFIGADSVDFLSIEGIYHALARAPGTMTDHAFTGHYPTRLTDPTRNGRFSTEWGCVPER
jgi:amidophosphoribosyltransferase